MPGNQTVAAAAEALSQIQQMALAENSGSMFSTEKMENHLLERKQFSLHSTVGNMSLVFRAILRDFKIPCTSYVDKVFSCENVDYAAML